MRTPRWTFRTLAVTTTCILVTPFLFTFGSQAEDQGDNEFKPGCQALDPQLIRCTSVSVFDANFDDQLETLANLLDEASGSGSHVQLQIFDSDVSYFPDDLLWGHNVTEVSFYVDNFEVFPEEFLMTAQSDITKLTLTSNDFAEFDTELFQLLPFASSLEQFTLRYAQLEDIVPLKLQSFVSLVLIDVSHNAIEFLPEDAFLGLYSLQFIDLSSNHLTILSPGTFAHLISLIELDLSGNMIILILAGTFVQLENLQFLGLQDNFLVLFEEMTLNQDDQPYLTAVTLGGNPFLCNSKLSWLKTWLTDRNILKASNAQCQWPIKGEFGEVDFNWVENLEHFENTTETAHED